MQHTAWGQLSWGPRSTGDSKWYEECRTCPGGQNQSLSALMLTSESLESG